MTEVAFRSALRFDTRWLFGVLLVMSAGGCGAAAHGHNMAGVRLFEQGQYPGALTQFQNAASTQPGNADAYYNMASTIHRMGTQKKDRALLDQAENLYNQCLDRDPNHVHCHRALVVLLAETGRSDKSFSLLKNWAASNPRSAEPRIELARLHEESGDRDEATRQLQDALKLDPQNARAFAALGHLREKAGDTNQALVNYQRSLQLDRNQPMVNERIATLQRQNLNLDITVPGGTRTATPPAKRY